MVGCRKGGMQERRVSGKVGFRKGGCRKGMMQERRNAGKEGCRKGGMQERKGEMQERRDTGLFSSTSGAVTGSSLGWG